ncbi:hypothetical protein [Sphaerisporangium aureirubrum]|uniref:Two-component sensor histidine kinase n=1 Tax=Sphaerisporangium aureirubrum TaxID=1544736 RepID=A0ABW1NMA0_9ACTN
MAIALTVLTVSLLLLAHGGPVPARVGSHPLDVVGVAFAACSAAPFLAWRRVPFAAFTVTAAATVALAGLGYQADLMPGPIAALYLLATGRDRATPWTRRGTVVVVGMLMAYLGTIVAAQRTFSGFELLHTGLPWVLAWFAGERTRLRGEQFADLRMRARHAEREAERGWQSRRNAAA